MRGSAGREREAEEAWEGELAIGGSEMVAVRARRGSESRADSAMADAKLPQCQPLGAAVSPATSVRGPAATERLVRRLGLVRGFRSSAVLPTGFAIQFDSGSGHSPCPKGRSCNF
jgi:hypothetical protein